MQSNPKGLAAANPRTCPNTAPSNPVPAGAGTGGRRSLVSSLAAFVVLPAAAPIVTAAVLEPDAMLIALGARHAEGVAECAAIYAEHDDEWDAFPEVEARMRALVSEGHRVVEQMAKLEATTLEGFKAKARVILHYSVAWSDGSPIYDSVADLLGWSLAMNLTGGEGWNP